MENQVFQFKNGPIEEVAWGKFKIFGQEHYKHNNGTRMGVGKDICLIGDRLHAWEERKGHLLNNEMVCCVAEADVDTVIIGNGFYGALQVPASVRQYLQGKGKKVMVEKTPEACRLFNELFNKGEKIALLAHGTC